MKTLWKGIKNNLKEVLTIFLVTLFISVGFFLLYIFVFNKLTIISCIDGATITFFVLFAIATLVVLIRLGTFDMLGYGFNTMFHYMFNAKKDRKYHDLIEYRDTKNTTRIKKKHYYLIIYFVSLLFLLTLIVFYIIYRVDLMSRL